MGDVSSLPFPAKLQAAVVLNPGYSTLPPIFSLCLNWKGERTGSNDDNIRVTWAWGEEAGELLGFWGCSQQFCVHREATGVSWGPGQAPETCWLWQRPKPALSQSLPLPGHGE